MRDFWTSPITQWLGLALPEGESTQVPLESFIFFGMFIAGVAVGVLIIVLYYRSIKRSAATEADRMIEAAAAAGRVLSVFQNRRWDSDYLTVRALLRQGAIGTPFYLEMAWEKFAPPRTWRGRRDQLSGRSPP